MLESLICPELSGRMEIDSYISKRVLAGSKTQNTLSQIWIYGTDFVPNNDNHYVKCTMGSIKPSLNFHKSRRLRSIKFVNIYQILRHLYDVTQGKCYVDFNWHQLRVFILLFWLQYET